MFEKYSEHSRRALFYARYEASKLGRPAIETEHVLLGLLREGEDSVRSLFERFGFAPEELRIEIEGDLDSDFGASFTAEPPLVEDTKRMLAFAAEEAEKMAHTTVDGTHLLVGFLRLGSKLATWILTRAGRDLDAVREDVVSIAIERQVELARKRFPYLSKHGTDLNLLAAQGGGEPAIGSDEMLDRVIVTFGRREKNNVLLVGGSGSGRRAVVWALAQRLAGGAVPAFLRGKRIVQLHFARLASSFLLAEELEARLRGLTEESRGFLLAEQSEVRLRGITEELRASADVVLFFDDAHTLFDAEETHELLAAGILIGLLLNDEFLSIGATDPSGYRRHMKDNIRFRRRFSRIRVPG